MGNFKRFQDTGPILRRCYLFLSGLEDMIAALTCSAYCITEATRHADGGVSLHVHLRWWAPACWVGWVRCIVFRDFCGSAYYCREEKVDEEEGGA